MLLVRSGLVSTVLTVVVRSTLSNAAGHEHGAATAASCRVAVCLSGHIRSFVHSTVHKSIRRNLIEAIEADGCDVDVFAYATATDTVAGMKRGRNSEFTSNSTDMEAALAFLAPTRTIWHQEQAGIVPNSCSVGNNQAPAAPTTDTAAAAAAAATTTAPTHNGGGKESGVRRGNLTRWWQRYKDEVSVNLYWQLYKSLAAYRMALREETLRGGEFTYDWIVRARFDVAWVRPLPPLRSFTRDAVWFSAQYWPMSDQFALVPRAFSDRFFATVKNFYACDGVTWPPSSSWFQQECSGSAFEESVLFRHLHATEVPYRVYPMFEYTITRGLRGGVCCLGDTVYRPACTVLAGWGAFKETTSGNDCAAALSEWANLRCRAVLPGGGLNDARSTDAVIDSDSRAWEELLVTPFSSPGTVVSGEAGGTAPVTVSKVDQWLTTVPETGEIDRAPSKLAALRDGLQEPTRSPQISRPPTIPDTIGGHGCGGGGGGGGSGGGGRVGGSGGCGGDGDGEVNGMSVPARPFGPDEMRRHPRWESWGETHPPSSVFSPAGCLLGTHPGLAPHLIVYYTMDTALVKEIGHAVQCFSHNLVEGTLWAGEEFDSSFCDDIRPLELVMIDMSHHVKELGLCTADSTTGLSNNEYVDRFFNEPKKHCVGIRPGGNMFQPPASAHSQDSGPTSCAPHVIGKLEWRR